MTEHTVSIPDQIPVPDMDGIRDWTKALLLDIILNDDDDVDGKRMEKILASLGDSALEALYGQNVQAMASYLREQRFHGI